ncbi:MAG: hypothetical protein LBP58_09050 [Azoarcus sp.]|jgi:hypothetical protein|nr:hypothetical protein [Azoarcus sp.]
MLSKNRRAVNRSHECRRTGNEKTDRQQEVRHILVLWQGSIGAIFLVMFIEGMQEWMSGAYNRAVRPAWAQLLHNPESP